MSRWILPGAACLMLLNGAGLWAQESAKNSAAPLLKIEFKEVEGGLEVSSGGKLFTRYLWKSGAKPILWPLVGPTGDELTRGYPMRDAASNERNDHIHHRSFWFTHGDVNGVSFWDEQGGNGEILHREVLVQESGAPATLTTRNDWVDPAGKRHCADQRTFRFYDNGQARWIDCDIVVSAPDADVKFGDTKEGSFGVRVAGDMKVDAKKGGRIVNSEGLTDGKAWGKPAAWVDYSGPAGPQNVVQGVAILNHPSSFRYPTHWHVRTYGLFAANPFGLHDFVSKDQDGSLLLKKGDSFTLRYRVYLHRGDAAAAGIDDVFAAYRKES